MKYLIGFIAGALLTFGIAAHAGFVGSMIGGAAGSAVATAGIESKVDSINARIDALTRAIDSAKVCKK